MAVDDIRALRAANGIHTVRGDVPTTRAARR